MKLTEPAVRQLENNSTDLSVVVDRPFDPIAFDIAMKKWRGFLVNSCLPTALRPPKHSCWIFEADRPGGSLKDAMITAIDTHVFIDILSEIRPQAGTAEQASRSAGMQGKLLVAILFYAELAGYFGNQVDLDSFLTSVPVRLLALDPAASFLVCMFHKEYKSADGLRRVSWRTLSLLLRRS